MPGFIERSGTVTSPENTETSSLVNPIVAKKQKEQVEVENLMIVDSSLSAIRHSS